MQIVPFEPSYTILATCFKGIRKFLVPAFGLSLSSVDKMMEEPRSRENPDGSGQRNFLDEYFISCHELRNAGRPEAAHALGRWAAHCSGGFFTPYFEPSNIKDNDFIKILSAFTVTTGLTMDGLRLGYFEGREHGSFTKEERSAIYKKLDDVMSACVTARHFVHEHKYEGSDDWCPHSHLFWHSSATHMIANGADVNKVQIFFFDEGLYALGGGDAEGRCTENQYIPKRQKG